MHRAPIWSLGFTPDGRELYSGGTDGVVHVWDAETGTHLRSLVGHRRAVLDIHFDGHDLEVVTASRDGSIGFWSRESGSLIRTVRRHEAGVFAIESTSTELVSASYDQTIRLSPSGIVLRGHTDAVTDLAVVGAHLISASRDRSVKIWSLESGTEIATRRAHSHWVTKVRTAGTAAFATASEDGTLAMWDIDAPAPRWRRMARPHQTPVWGFDVSADGRLAVTGDASGVPRLWDLECGMERTAFAPGHLANRACALSPDGRLVAFGNDDTSLTVFDVASGTQRWRARGAGLGILSALVSDDRRTVIIGHTDGTIKARCLGGGAAPAFKGHQRFVYQMRRIAPSRFASAAFDGTIAAWDLETGEQLGRCQHGGAIFAIAVWDDGKRAATAGGRAVRLWDLTNGTELATLPVRGSGSHSFVAASPDGRTLLLVAETGEMDVWNIDKTGVPSLVAGIDVALDTDMLSALAITPDARAAVAATAGGVLLVIGLEQRRVVARFSCHEDWIRDLRITPDSRHIVASCQDGALNVLELATGDVVDVGLSQVPVAAVSVAGDGTLAAVDIQGNVHFLASL